MEDDNRDQEDTEETLRAIFSVSGFQHAPLAPLQVGVV